MVLWIPSCPLSFRIRGFHPLSQVFPVPFCYNLGINYTVRTPKCTHFGLGSFHFARRYFGNRLFSFFSSGYLDVSVHRVPFSYTIYSYMDDRSSSCRVSPFRNLRVVGYLLLSVAYRSLSRLSSALSAKASTMCSLLLDLLYLLAWK